MIPHYLLPLQLAPWQLHALAASECSCLQDTQPRGTQGPGMQAAGSSLQHREPLLLANSCSPFRTQAGCRPVWVVTAVREPAGLNEEGQGVPPPLRPLCKAWRAFRAGGTLLPCLGRALLWANFLPLTRNHCRPRRSLGSQHQKRHSIGWFGSPHREELTVTGRPRRRSNRSPNLFRQRGCGHPAGRQR